MTLEVPRGQAFGYDETTQCTERSFLTDYDRGERRYVAVNGNSPRDDLATLYAGSGFGLSSEQIPGQLDESALRGSQRDTPELILEELLQACIPAYDSHQGYIPIKELERILDYETIKAVLPVCLGSRNADDEFTKKATIVSGIVQEERGGKPSLARTVSYRKTLAILILAEMHTHLQCFLDCGLDDSKLPIHNKSIISGEYRLCLRDSDNSLDCFQGWSRHKMNLFYERQWKVLAPFFSRVVDTDEKDDPKQRAINYELDKQVPLPFKTIKHENPDAGSKQAGNTAEVSFVEIHKDHMNLPSYSSRSTKPHFALKKLRPFATKKDFDHEVAILKKLSHHRNDHLVKLLFTMELQELQYLTTEPSKCEFYLVFPLATGDLNTLWNTNKPHTAKGPNETAGFVRWVGKQCLGITEALNIVHGFYPKDGTKSSKTNDPYYGIHADIKPANLLWFQDWRSADYHLGTIQLADFGISNFHHTDSRSNATLLAHTRTYRAPEIELGQTISSSFDIWGLGCVFLEFISWVILGIPQKTKTEHPVDAFSNARLSNSKTRDQMVQQDTFYRLHTGRDSTSADLNPAVIQRIQEIHSHKNCTEFLHGFLDIVRSGMLVIEDRPLRNSWKQSNGDNNGERMPPLVITGTPKRRFTCREVISQLSELIERADNDASQALYTEGKPREKFRGGCRLILFGSIGASSGFGGL
ncbi:kinase-like domain-containing protein [Cladorrhinum sp. PSN332]|nr:kinase-like domain-containing protein [Cladorrhinum sp. PSN332]